VFEAWETPSGLFFLQQVVIVRLHTVLLDPTLDAFLLCTHRKWVVGIVPQVCLKATLTVSFPWLSNLIAQRSSGTRVCLRSRKRRWRWWNLRVGDVFNAFEVGKRVQVLNRICVSVDFITLSRFNTSGRAATSQILCHLTVFSMV
jgi:hypothetical protein